MFTIKKIVKLVSHYLFVCTLILSGCAGLGAVFISTLNNNSLNSEFEFKNIGKVKLSRMQDRLTLDSMTMKGKPITQEGSNYRIVDESGNILWDITTFFIIAAAEEKPSDHIQFVYLFHNFFAAGGGGYHEIRAVELDGSQNLAWKQSICVQENGVQKYFFNKSLTCTEWGKEYWGEEGQKRLWMDARNYYKKNKDKLAFTPLNPIK